MSSSSRSACPRASSAIRAAAAAAAAPLPKGRRLYPGPGHPGLARVGARGGLKAEPRPRWLRTVRPCHPLRRRRWSSRPPNPLLLSRLWPTMLTTMGLCASCAVSARRVCGIACAGPPPTRALVPAAGYAESAPDDLIVICEKCERVAVHQVQQHAHGRPHSVNGLSRLARALCRPAMVWRWCRRGLGTATRAPQEQVRAAHCDRDAYTLPHRRGRLLRVSRAGRSYEANTERQKVRCCCLPSCAPGADRTAPRAQGQRLVPLHVRAVHAGADVQ